MQEYRRQERLMGSAFEFAIAIPDGPERAEALLNDCVAEVRRLEALLTEFSDTSDTGRINGNAGIAPVVVAEETAALLVRSTQISALTSGAFDVSAGALKKLYTFKNGEAVPAEKAAVAATIALTGYRQIEFYPDNAVFLPRKGMRIGFGGIGKGYAADRVRTLLRQKGVLHAAVNASGDLSIWGARPDGAPWKAGIAHPDRPGEIVYWLPVSGEMCIATSGNYEKYFEYRGRRYGHTIDPRNGLPVTGIKSVTVISPGAELSDALATAVTVMGVREGLDFIGQLPQTHCIIIDDHNKVHTSRHLHLHEN
ncbi:MAG: FAD:protein FMN transferase [Lewinellaceae bacterium]|nr:FAD:protein FMN transferase [Saprospiraceae bacterium]MCB9305545.1 FAD:protein FMN transferase [Lewinellaceae bacterium]MCB9355059.1 FAD:protein FMN transferase [Lewinellaceae bacterium]